MSKLENLLKTITGEVERAATKYPRWPTDPLHALAVLGEEFGELTKATLQLSYEPYKTSPREVRSEAIQTAAMAIRFALSLDRYEYCPGDQHPQEVGQPSLNAALPAGTTDWPWRAVKDELPALNQTCLLLLADGSIRFGSYEYNYNSDYYSWSTSRWDVGNDDNPAVFWIYASDIPQPKLPEVKA